MLGSFLPPVSASWLQAPLAATPSPCSPFRVMDPNLRSLSASVYKKDYGLLNIPKQPPAFLSFPHEIPIILNHKAIHLFISGNKAGGRII